MKKRSYHQNCALARAADLLGERWTLLIFRELLIQPCRFKQLNFYLSGMGTNLLAQRLKELELHGFIDKNPNDKRSDYQLTPKGRTVESVIMSMVRWGFSNTLAENDGSHFHHWDLLAMKSLFNPEECKSRIAIQFSSEQLMGWCIVDPVEGCDIGVGELGVADDVYSGTVQKLHKALNTTRTVRSPVLRKFTQCFTSNLSQ